MPSSPCHCINLRRANKAVTDFYDRRLGACGVTVNQYALLCAAGRLPDASVSGLAHELGLERSTLVRTLRPLLDAGLVADGSAPGARNRRLNLTPAGRRVRKRGHSLWQEAQAELEGKLGNGKMAAFRAVLDALRDL